MRWVYTYVRWLVEMSSWTDQITMHLDQTACVKQLKYPGIFLNLEHLIYNQEREKLLFISEWNHS